MKYRTYLTNHTFNENEHRVKFLGVVGSILSNQVFTTGGKCLKDKNGNIFWMILQVLLNFIEYIDGITIISHLWILLMNIVTSRNSFFFFATSL